MRQLPETILLGIALCFAIPLAQAVQIPLGAASDYVVLYSSVGKTLQVDDVTIAGNATILGNIGVGSTGKFNENSNKSDITGRLDFSAALANPNQFSSSAGSGPTSVNYGVGGVQTAITAMTNLSSSLAGTGTALAINGPQTVNETDGQLQTIGGVNYRIFNVSSYTFNDNEIFTINGDGSDNAVVVFNFGFNNDIDFKGTVKLTGGLNQDQVLFNVTNPGKSILLDDKADFQGTILAPGAKQLEMGSATLTGRFFGSFSQSSTADNTSTIHSGAYISAGPLNGAPEPSSIALLAGALAGLAVMRRRRAGEMRLAPAC